MGSLRTPFAIFLAPQLSKMLEVILLTNDSTNKLGDIPGFTDLSRIFGNKGYGYNKQHHWQLSFLSFAKCLHL